MILQITKNEAIHLRNVTRICLVPPIYKERVSRVRFHFGDGHWLMYDDPNSELYNKALRIMGQSPPNQGPYR